MALTFIQSSGNALQICGAETGHHVTSVAFCDTPERAAMLAQAMRIAEANSALAASILALLGNVDHGNGNGPNSAKMRGDLLNSIREMCVASRDGRL